ncbi:MAG: 4Fe-4S dicluster domain-containing protein [Candidatus Rokubacteria bacterium]|nr:4Fe-4S dicluster domain-containing protein [Candidatus Rokubacteria bacterium]MBI4255583.1 4Fe-4S dicluster domain-containing protein [Candidatus Rokubacteria bacterium]
MALWGMVIDLDRCTGCQACVMACKAENNVPAVGAKEAARGRTISWMHVLVEESAERTRFLPRPCFQCDDPPCTKVCPVYATYRNPEGIVAQIYARCIGCRFCMAGCPYNAKYFNWHRYQKEGPGQNPDVSVRPKGVVEKCTFCHHRLQKARDRARAERRELAAGDYVTACAEACPTRAITFGDLSDSGGEVARLARSPRAFRVGEELGTKPKVIYLSETEAQGRG